MQLINFTLGSVMVSSNSTVQGTITLSGPAGPSGRTVLLSSTDPAINIPASVVVPPGQTTVTFDIVMGLLTLGLNFTIQARIENRVVRRKMTVVVAQLGTLQFTPNPVDSEGTVTLQVNLSVPAGYGGVTVRLTEYNNESGNRLFLPGLPQNVTVAAGDTSVSLDVAVAKSLNDVGTYVRAEYDGAYVDELLGITGYGTR